MSALYVIYDSEQTFGLVWFSFWSSIHTLSERWMCKLTRKFQNESYLMIIEKSTKEPLCSPIMSRATNPGYGNWAIVIWHSRRDIPAMTSKYLPYTFMWVFSSHFIFHLKSHSVCIAFLWCTLMGGDVEVVDYQLIGRRILERTKWNGTKTGSSSACLLSPFRLWYFFRPPQPTTTTATKSAYTF